MTKTIKLALFVEIMMLIAGISYPQKIETKDGVRLVHNEKEGKWGK